MGLSDTAHCILVSAAHFRIHVVRVSLADTRLVMPVRLRGLELADVTAAVLFGSKQSIDLLLILMACSIHLKVF